MSENSISLNKFISSTGKCSRREADRWIDEGRVLINGVQGKKGNRVSPGDRVSVDGKVIKRKTPDYTYIILNKPPGITCTTDQRDHTNIIDFINFKKRIFPIGRLDKASSGLIMLTNDGDIVNKILRVENNHDKEYIVKVDKPINGEFLKRMSSGIPILGTKTKRCELKKLGKSTFSIILTQGLNRQIRRMCEYLGYKVLTLKRIRIMHVELGDLQVGSWRYLSKNELEILHQKIK